MVEFKVRYRLGGEVYESRVFAASSGSAIKWAEQAFPGATNVTVLRMHELLPIGSKYHLTLD